MALKKRKISSKLKSKNISRKGAVKKAAKRVSAKTAKTKGKRIKRARVQARRKATLPPEPSVTVLEIVETEVYAQPDLAMGDQEDDIEIA
ncbi:MAG: hypothetical protein ACXV5J_06380 [Candidatus Angelobacter sp.]